MLQVVDGKGFNVQCEQCSKVLHSDSGLKLHLRMHQGLHTYTCELCGKGINSKNQFEGHMNRHRGVRPHICYTCGKTFFYLSAMQRHAKKCA